MRSRIEPMKKIARSLRQHRELILNYFRAHKLVSSGVVEGLNNKAKVTMRKSYGFRTYRVLELALYHALGKLPEPESTHDFFLRTHFFNVSIRAPTEVGNAGVPSCLSKPVSTRLKSAVSTTSRSFSSIALLSSIPRKTTVSWRRSRASQAR